MANEFVILSSHETLELQEFEELRLQRMESSLLQIQQPPRVVRRRITVEYQFVNHEWPNEIAILRTCDGKISFQSRNNVTPWHGAIRLTEDLSEPLIAMFDCYGKQLKSHVLYFRGNEHGKPKWVGKDYRGRDITMYWLGMLEWDDFSKTWSSV